MQGTAKNIRKERMCRGMTRNEGCGDRIRRDVSPRMLRDIRSISGDMNGYRGTLQMRRPIPAFILARNKGNVNRYSKLFRLGEKNGGAGEWVKTGSISRVLPLCGRWRKEG